MKIFLLEPFFTGSHKAWAKGYQQFSQHHIEIVSLSGRHWKWRMHGAAVSMAEKLKHLKETPDLFLCTDFLDVAVFKGLLPHRLQSVPIALYFHENQLTYPWSSSDNDVKLNRDNHYAFINYTSALCADKIFYNSPYHLHSFIEALPNFLKQFPDLNNLYTIDCIRKKSTVLHLGINLRLLNNKNLKIKNKLPHILWNHRWEYDKAPELFFSVLKRLKKEGYLFKLIVLGRSYSKQPKIFQEAKKVFSSEIVHFGYVNSVEQYASLLDLADVLPVTSKQDFFGASVVEAIFADTFPILPKRLSYPMHIPVEQRDKHLYDGTEEALYNSLRTFIEDFLSEKIDFSFKHYVVHYDWRTLASHYDYTLEKLSRL